MKAQLEWLQSKLELEANWSTTVLSLSWLSKVKVGTIFMIWYQISLITTKESTKCNNFDRNACITRPQWVKRCYKDCGIMGFKPVDQCTEMNRNAEYHHALQWRHNGHDSVSNHQPHDCLLNRLLRRRTKETSKLRVTGLCAGNSLGTGEFPAQMVSNAENVSIWWRHHGESMQKSYHLDS